MARTKTVKFTVKSFLIGLGALMLMFPGCSKQNPEYVKKVSKVINDFSFEAACYSLTGKCDNETAKKIFYPKQLDLYAGRSYWEKGICYYAIEHYFPEKIGVIESLLFYNPYDEKADWVEELVIAIEEERIAGEILAMEDALEEAEYVPEDLNAEIEKALSDEIETVSRIGKDNKLRIMEYDQEIFIPQETDENFITIDSDGNLIKRSFYDSQYRLVKKEYWQINSHSDGKLKESEEYVFGEEGYRPIQKSYRTEERFTNTDYNDAGQAIHSKEYKTVEFKKESKKTGKVKTTTQDVVTAEYTWNYNSDGKIQEQLCTLYFYDESYNNLEYSFVKKYIYMYNDFETDEDEDIPPDFEYYENDVLKMKNKYTAELGTYTSQVYFENDFAVKTYYEKYKKVRDVYTSGKIVKRVKKYE